MPAEEIAGRLASRWKLRRLERWAQDPEPLANRVGGFEQAVLRGCQRLVPGTSVDQWRTLQECYPAEAHRLVQRCASTAEVIAEGNFQLLGRKVVIGREIDWHADPVTGHRWNDDFFGRVSYHQVPTGVDFKHIWELGRHQYVVELTRAWMLTRSTSHLDLARQVVDDWIASNPFCRGIHWTSGLEVAMRAISWIWTLATARDAWQRDPKLRTWIGQLSLHGHYIENHLSVHSSPYNHIIGEATALYLLGIAFEGAPDAERWRSKGRTLLRDFGPQQFYRDGFCVEQAVGYHYYTLGFLTLAMLAGRATGDDQLQLEGLIRKGYSAGAAMRQPDGTWPAIGDVDSARSVPIAHNNFWDFASLHRLAAVALNEPALAFGGDRFSEETYWMLGAAGIARGKAMEGTVPPNQVTVLPHAGYYTARQQDDWMLLDCGPIAGGLHRDGTPSTAHGHADTLQLLVHWGGRAVLRDTGMSNYAGNAKRMDHFRSPAAHNTVWLEGAPLVRPAGRLGWAHNVSSTSLRWVDDPEYWRACGEVTWGKCTIRRQVFAIPDEAVWIADWLDSDVPRTAHWAWQLVDSAWVMVEQSQRRVELSCGTFGMQCIATVDALGCEMIVPDREGCEGWYCPGYGELATGRAARLRLPLTSSALVLTVLGAPRRTVIFSKDGQELRLPFETSYPAPDGGPKDLKECCYDSLGGGIWRLGV